MSVVFRYKEVLTRKPHNCFGCMDVYPAKSKMYKNDGINEGNEIYSLYFCSICNAYINNVDVFEDGGIHCGELKENNYGGFFETLKGKLIKLTL